MEDMSKWSHKDICRRRGKHFLIEVSHHEGEPSAFNPTEGHHRWCVYAYIYPGHPHFEKFEGPEMWQEAATCLPLHGGPSMLKWHADDDGNPTSVQVGADYNHLHDDHFTHMATATDALEVFDDADRLYDWLASTTDTNESTP